MNDRIRGMEKEEEEEEEERKREGKERKRQRVEELERSGHFQHFTASRSGDEPTYSTTHTHTHTYTTTTQTSESAAVWPRSGFLLCLAPILTAE